MGREDIERLEKEKLERDLRDKEMMTLLKSIQNEVKSLKIDIKLMKGAIIGMKPNFDHHTDMIRALEESLEVSKAEVEKIIGVATQIKGDTKTIKKDMSNIEIITASNWVDIAKLKVQRNDEDDDI